MKNSKAVYRPVPGGTKDFLLFENIEGMCKPLQKMLNMRDIKLEDLKVKHFFPYIHIATGKQGYFFKQKDGSFKTLTQQQWRSILRGKANNLRPKDGIPKNNRMKALNLDTNEEIDICYWPDVQYEYYLKMMHKKKPPTSSGGGDSNIKKRVKGDPKTRFHKQNWTIMLRAMARVTKKIPMKSCRLF